MGVKHHFASLICLEYKNLSVGENVFIEVEGCGFSEELQTRCDESDLLQCKDPKQSFLPRFSDSLGFSGVK